MADFPESVTTTALTTGIPSSRRRPTYLTTSGDRFATTVTELHRSRRMEDRDSGLTLTRVFIIQGTKNPVECIDLGPQRGDTLEEDERFYVTARSVEEYGRAGNENDACRLTVTYQAAGQNDSVIDDPNENTGGGGGGGGSKEEAVDIVKARVSFAINGESVHVTEALSQQSFKDGALAGFGDTIGVTDNGAEGVTIQAGLLTFTETHRFSGKALTAGYLQTLRDLSFTVNNADFRGFQEGEVLFNGISAAQQEGSVWALTFQFQVRRNESWNVSLITSNGDTNDEVGEKEGWEYLWTRNVRRTVEKDGLGIQYHGPWSVHVAQVYKKEDFNALNIGTGAFTFTPGLSDGSTIDGDADDPATLSLGFPI